MHRIFGSRLMTTPVYQKLQPKGSFVSLFLKLFIHWWRTPTRNSLAQVHRCFPYLDVSRMAYELTTNPATPATPPRWIRLHNMWSRSKFNRGKGKWWPISTSWHHDRIWWSSTRLATWSRNQQPHIGTSSTGFRSNRIIPQLTVYGSINKSTAF